MQNEREQLIKDFNNLNYEVDRIYTKYAKTKDLTQTSLFVLEYLFESKEPVSQKEISDYLGIHKQAINLSIKYFLEKEFIQMKETKDRRIKNIVLTEAGLDFASEVLKPLRKAGDNVWHGVKTHDIAILVKVMGAYVDNIKLVCE